MSGPVTAHTPALLLQRILVDLAVFHDQLKVVLIIQHHIDIVQRVTQSDVTGRIYFFGSALSPSYSVGVT